MRLIDADELRKQLSTMCPLYATDEYDYCTKDILDKVDVLVQKQPTAYDVDKVVKELEECAIIELGITKEKFEMDRGEYSGYCALSLTETKEIVKSGCIE